MGKSSPLVLIKYWPNYIGLYDHEILSSLLQDCTGRDPKGQSSEHVEEEGLAKEGLIVQIKLQDTSTLSIQDESWKPKREKQRKDYAELFGQRKKLSEEEREKMVEIYDLIVNKKVRLTAVKLFSNSQY